jgi:hypothetical protein
MPSGNGSLVEPERQVASALQPCFVLWPVPDLVAGSEVFGPVWVGSDGHEWASGLVEADVAYPVAPPLPTSMHQRLSSLYDYYKADTDRNRSLSQREFLEEYRLLKEVRAALR